LELAKEFPENMILLDHHPTAEHLQGVDRCIIDTRPTVCGATMCYKHLLLDNNYKCDNLKSLAAIARDYDCWIHKLPKNIAKNLNFIYYKYWGEKFIERFINGFDGFNREETQFINDKWKEIQDKIKNTNFIDVMGDMLEHKNKFCMIVPHNSVSEEVNELCEHAIKVLGYHVVMYVNPHKNKISTRVDQYSADKGLHVGNFHAENCKIGGGHPRAGGATYESEEHLEKICENMAEKIIQFNI
jgi:oligoribonuclease NrnB/cAMP/cGMP phosphodiesterase (DHH superfamily)